MIKSLIKNLVLVLAVVGGSVGAGFLKAQAPSDEHRSEDGGEGHEGKEESDGKSKAGSDDGGSTNYDTVSYLKFKRQFIVPVMENKRIKELVLMNFNVELNENAPENSLSLEPKLRDAFIKDLLTLSNQGVLSGDITSPETYEALRAALVTSSHRILPEGVENVLILDISKQEM